jgi:hypothetical protein
MEKRILRLIVCVLLFMAKRADGAFVYTSGTPDPTGSDLNSFSGVAAESFSLSVTTTIRGVRFYTHEASLAWDGTLDYFFFGHNAPFPGSHVLSSGHNPAYTKTFIIDGGSTAASIVEYNFDPIIPITLGPGTYWLGLHLQDDFDCCDGAANWLATTTPNAQISAFAPNGDFNGWQLQGLQLAFALSDAPLVNVAISDGGTSLVMLLLAFAALPVLKKRHA